MKLMLLHANSAWAFVLWNKSLERMGQSPLFFATRVEAVQAAEAMGLKVAQDGLVSVAGSPIAP